jgi:hypothetical protein
MKMNLGNKDNRKRRRAVTYLPPPMTKIPSASEGGGNGEGMRWGVENKGEMEKEKEKEKVEVEDVVR